MKNSKEEKPRQPVWFFILVVLVAVLLVLLLDSCKVPKDRELTAEVAREAACPSWRQVAVKSNSEGACPSAPGWRVRHLFETESTAAEDLPPGLRPFCIYEMDGSGDPKALASLDGIARVDRDCSGFGPSGDVLRDLIWKDLQDQFFIQAGKVENLPLSSPQDVRLAFLDSQATRDGLPQHAGHSRHGYSLALMARQLTCGVSAAAGVPETTAPAASEGAEIGNDRDGDDDTRVFRTLAISEGGCATRITSQLALPIVHFDKNEPWEVLRDGDAPDPEVDYPRRSLRDERSAGAGGRGGYFGTISDLALAVRREVESWQDPSREDPPSARRLVLNLSVGWDGGLFGDVPEGITACTDSDLGSQDVEPSALAVFCALQDASCRGALTVAAAGNRSGGPKPRTGPLLPAAWEQRDAPRPETCDRILGETADREIFAEEGSEPLVYAVGGVDSRGNRLANARPGAEPPLVAYGDHGIVADPGSVRPTATLTGTSVATAVVASTAAVVWNNNPYLRRSEVMDLLYEAGTPVPEGPGQHRVADFHHPQAKPDVHRVTLRSALAGACAREGSVGCPDERMLARAPGYGTPYSLRAKLKDFVDHGERIYAAPMLAKDVLPTPFPNKDPCKANKLFYPPGKEPRNPCPFDQFYSAPAHAWNSPQPPVDPCPNCGVFSNSPCTLVINVPRKWRKGALYDATLDIDFGDGSGDMSGHHYYALGDLLPSAGLELNKPTVVTDITECSRVTDAVSMSLSFRIRYQGDDISVESPVLIVD